MRECIDPIFVSAVYIQIGIERVVIAGLCYPLSLQHLVPADRF
jgi:hypothetical protein